MTLLAVAASGAAAFTASVVSGVAGFGGAALLLPVMVWALGERASIPVLTVAVLMGNASRAWFYRKHLDWAVAGWFCLGAVPMAVLGSVVYVHMPGTAIRRAIGAFLVASVAYRRLRKPAALPGPRWFAPVGAVSGFLAAIVGAVGPLAAPFFLHYGLIKEAYVGTEALGAAATHLTKTLAYGQLHVLGARELGLGVFYGTIMTAGSWVAKQVLERLPRERFLQLVEAMLVVVGLSMLRG